MVEIEMLLSNIPNDINESNYPMRIQSTYQINDVVEVSRRMQSGLNCQGGKARITNISEENDEYRFVIVNYGY